MDKHSIACYTGRMQRSLTPLILLLFLSGTAGGGMRPADNLSQWDVESMYVQAKAMLEDRSIQNVEAVPMLLETCAREKHIEAALLLMDVYEGKFKGLTPNPEKATSQARSMAEAPQLDKVTPGGREARTAAMYRLALYQEKGNGCNVNKQEAFKWMQQAARRNMPQAKVELARYLMTGVGVKQAPEEAWRLLHEQALQAPETPHLFFYMGYMCYQGLGIPRNARKAFELFRMGARLNDARCLNNLGAMFEKGYPTPRNPENALRLYRKAANLGNREASANMQRLAFKEGIRAQHISSTPNETRIDNATLHIIQALPVSEYTRDRLKGWLLLNPDKDAL